MNGANAARVDEVIAAEDDPVELRPLITTSLLCGTGSGSSQKNLSSLKCQHGLHWRSMG